ncbi:MAG: kelch repeat-containing protein, partial [Terriglobales bacterium]
AGAGAAYDSTLQQVVMFGGYDRQYLNDTWLWDGATSTWTEVTPAKSPKPMTLPMLFPDPRTGNVDEFGGYAGKFYQYITWRWKDGIWKKQYPKQSPGARAAAVIGTNPVLKQTVVFGGLADVNPVNTWTFDGKNWTQQFPATQPPQRLDVGTVYDPRFHGVVTFGGFIGVDANDMWLWDGSNWTQLFPKKSPPPREQMGMAFFDTQLETVVFGGLSGNNLLNDTWVLKTLK